MKVTMIDPPGGWRYGFPKEAPKGADGSTGLRDWFLKQGYPEKDVELAIKYSRYWTQDEEQDKNN